MLLSVEENVAAGVEDTPSSAAASSLFPNIGWAADLTIRDVSDLSCGETVMV